jgi:hypothetical protein
LRGPFEAVLSKLGGRSPSMLKPSGETSLVAKLVTSLFGSMQGDHMRNVSLKSLGGFLVALVSAAWLTTDATSSCLSSIAIASPHEERRESAPPSASSSPTRVSSNEIEISREEYGAAWPFTVDRGILKGVRVGKTSDGSPLAHLTFTAQGKVYAVNGLARGTKKYAEIEDIWAANPEIPGTRIDIGPIIDRGLKLAEGINVPFVTPAPKPPPQSAKFEPMRCEKFEFTAVFEKDQPEDRKKVTLALRTDLPDDTVVLVSISRSFDRVSNGEQYSEDYFEERSTIEKWRKPRTIELLQSTWADALKRRQKTMDRLGEKFQAKNIAQFAEACIVVPMNQPNKAFGPRNANLTGAQVTVDGDSRVIRKAVRLPWALKAE